MPQSDTERERLRFSRLDDEACSLLQEARPLIEKELPEVLDGFYEHISKYTTPSSM